MRVLFSSSPAFGHVLPLLPLARAARAGGAQVAVATSVDFADVVAPLPLLAAGPSFPDVAAEFYRRTGSSPVAGLEAEAFGELFGAVRIDLTFEQTLAAGRALAADLVIAEREDTVGPMVAAALGIPWACFLLGADLPVQISQAIAARAQERYAAHGLTVLSPAAVVDPWPVALQPPGWQPQPHRVVIRPEPHTAPGAHPGPGTTGAGAPVSGRPRVLVTPGTIADDADAVSALVTSLLDLADPGVDVVLTGRHGLPWPLGAVPERVQQVGFTPLAQLLDGVDVAVVAGGSGTVVGALARGVPLVVLPLVFDQALNAERAAATGAAVVSASPQDVGTAVQAVLTDPAIRTAAQALAQRIAAMDSPDRAWQHVLHLALP